MKFAVLATYTTDKAKTAEIRPLHRAHLTDLFKKGKLAISGPFGDDSGGLLVFEAESKEEVEALLAGDPFVKNGVITSTVIQYWNTVFVNAELLPQTGPK
jgi:uncharacterized protein YciI